jgi:hypothetical protein
LRKTVPAEYPVNPVAKYDPKVISLFLAFKLPDRSPIINLVVEEYKTPTNPSTKDLSSKSICNQQQWVGASAEDLENSFGIASYRVVFLKGVGRFRFVSHGRVHCSRLFARQGVH